MFELELITQEKYNSLIELDIHSKLDILCISKYPYKSLESLFDNVTNYEKTKIKKIEDLNIYHFLSIINLLFGVGDKARLDLFNASLDKEPLRTAVFLAKQEHEPKGQFATFVYYACKILLSNGGKTNNLIYDPIDVKISGKMPFSLFSNKQSRADNWYKSFVEHKLSLAKLALTRFEKDEVYSILLHSVACSLFHFTRQRYSIVSYCKDETEAVCSILRIFINNLRIVDMGFHLFAKKVYDEDLYFVYSLVEEFGNAIFGVSSAQVAIQVFNEIIDKNNLRDKLNELAENSHYIVKECLYRDSVKKFKYARDIWMASERIISEMPLSENESEHIRYGAHKAIRKMGLTYDEKVKFIKEVICTPDISDDLLQIIIDSWVNAI